jgi:hypothetical protein
MATRTFITDDDELDALPAGARIVDNGVTATKTSDEGGWLYDTGGAGSYWYPLTFPVQLLP